MAQFSQQDIVDGIWYREYAKLFKKQIAENEEVEIRRGSIIIKGLLTMVISALVIVFAFYFAIFLFSEVLDIDMSKPLGRIAITTCGLILFAVCIVIFRKNLARIRRVKAIGDKIRKPDECVLKHIDEIVTEISSGSIEDNPRFIEFESVNFAGSLYERRERWRGVLFDAYCFFYQPKTKLAKLVSKSTIKIEEKSKKSEVSHYLIFLNQELKGINKLSIIVHSRFSEFMKS